MCWVMQDLYHEQYDSIGVSLLLPARTSPGRFGRGGVIGVLTRVVLCGALGNKGETTNMYIYMCINIYIHK